MSLVDVLNKIAWDSYYLSDAGAGDRQLVEGAIANLYNNAPTNARPILDEIANNSTLLSFIYFQGHAGGDASGYFVEFDPAYGNDLLLISKEGVAYKPSLEEVLMHELIHAVKDLHDPEYQETPHELNFNANADHVGDTVELNNLIMHELGLPERASYFGTADAGELQTTQSFTEGLQTDLVFVDGTNADFIDRQSYDQYTTSLLIGKHGGDVILGGLRDDYIYGGDGNDLLFGGAGNDVISGGELGRPTGSDGFDTVRYQTDLTQPETGITVEIGGSGPALDGLKPILVTNDGHGDQDRLYSIEKIIGTEEVDTIRVLTLDATSVGAIKWIDLRGGLDKIDLSAISGGVTVNLIDLLNQTASGSGGTLHLRNVNQVIGTGDEDKIYGPDRLGPIFGNDPLILDLDGDGIELQPLTFTSPHFDIDSDGQAEQLGWVGADDGLLARDLNGNGTIDDAGELFGKNDQSGFAALAELDGNEDGVIDSSDSGFADLRVWRDADGDAVTDVGELKTLAELDIASISLTTSDPAPGEEEIEGNIVTAVGTYTLGNGTTREAADVALVYDDGAVAGGGGGSGGGGSGGGGSGGGGSGSGGDDELVLLDGGGGDDIIIGGRVAADIRGGAGDDTVEAHGINSEIDLGAGNDTVKFAAQGTIIQGGAGEDKIWVSDGILFADAEVDDKILFKGLVELHGGTGWHYSESPYVYHASGLFRFGINTDGDLVIEDFVGDQMFVANYVGGPGAAESTAGIYLAEFDTSATRVWEDIPPGYSILNTWRFWCGDFMKANFGVSFWKAVDPLILDLDGDGVELTAQTSVSPRFDIDGDGYLERTAWVRGDDAFLVFDANENSIVDGVQELFGGVNISGFTALSALDSNSDDLIDSNDADFADLRVWQDLNGNAISDAGELKTLSEVGITSISLNATPLTNSWNELNQVTEESTFTRADGSTGQIVDVLLNIDNQRTVWSGSVEIDPDAAELPNLKGYGTLVDLHVAMTLDPSFQETVEDTLPLLGSLDLAEMRAAAKPILLGWALASPLGNGPGTLNQHSNIPILVGDDGGEQSVLDFAYRVTDANGTYWVLASGASVLDDQDNVINRPTYSDVLAQSSEFGDWSFFDGELLGFLERFSGESLPIDTTPTNATTALYGMTQLLTTFWQTINLFTVRLAVQGPLASYFEAIDYDLTTDHFKANTGQQLIPVFENIFEEANENHTADAAEWLAKWNPILDVVIADYDRGGSYLKMTYSFLFSNIVAAYESVGLPIGIQEASAGLGIPQDILVTGSGDLVGSTDADIFYLAGGDQTAEGGVGPDAYIVGANFGHDVIDDSEAAGTTQEPDIVRFASINSTDVTAYKDGLDLIIEVNGTDDELRIEEQFIGKWPGLFGGNLLPDRGVSEIVFADGVVWTHAEIARAVSHPQATDDTLIGTRDSDWLDGGAGNDFLSGGDQADVYIFGAGYGTDTIAENQINTLVDSTDFVVFQGELTVDDVVFSRIGSSEDLQISIVGTDDKLIIEDQFSASYTGVFGTQWWTRVEGFLFQDDSVVSWDEVMINIVRDAKTSGDNTIYGFDFEDVLDGGAGNDLLIGGNDNDTYIFGRGYGVDTIDEGPDNILSGMFDVVQFNADVAPADLILERGEDRDDLIVYIAGTDDKLVIKDTFVTYTLPLHTDYIEEFHFADGTIWTWSDITLTLLDNESTEGNDFIRGFDTQDRLDGGAGDDRLEGWANDDTYVFGRGYGHDTIFDEPVAAGADEGDSVEFLPGITPGDLAFSRNGDDLIITITDTGDQLTIEDQLLYTIVGNDFDIESFHFSDGTVWGVNDIHLALLQSTSGDDHLIGFQSDDVLDGGAGNDRLEGQEGSDTYIFDVGYGRDVICDTAWYVTYTSDDEVEFGSGITTNDLAADKIGSDLVIYVGGIDDILTIEDYFSGSYYEVEEFHFADGTVWTRSDIDALVAQYQGPHLIFGTSGNDTLEGGDEADLLVGGTGDDTLDGGDGGDDYQYASGDGSDLILETVVNTGTDRLVLTDLNTGDLTFSRAPDDTGTLLIAVNATGDVVRVDDQFVGDPRGIEQIVFADSTTWDRTEIGVNAWFRGTAAAENFTGGSIDETFVGAGGDDTLSGGAGSDSYRYASTDGNDFIDEGSSSGTDKLVLTNLNSADVTVLRMISDTNDLVIAVNATNESIRINNQFLASNYGIEQVVFADGTTWDRATVLANAGFLGTAGADTINGSSSDDTIIGAGGDDTLNGGAGSDTYRYASGDGNDFIDEGSSTGTDRIVFTDLNASDVTFSRLLSDTYDFTITTNSTAESIRINNQFLGTNYGVEQVVFADGTIWDRATIQSNAWYRGTSGNDTITGEVQASDDTIVGAGGDDTLNGWNGSDTYRYASGDGNDFIDEGSSTGTDTLVLTNLNATDVFLSRVLNDTYDFTVTTITTGESIRVDNQFLAANYGLEQIVFADGTTWDGAAILSNAWFRGTAGNDSITATSGNDTIVGYAGNDTLNGGAGADTLIGGLGDDTFIADNVSDVVTENSGEGTDTVQSGATFTLSANVENLTLTGSSAINGTGNGDANIITGNVGNNTLTGLGGNDTLNGGGGTDTFVGGLGDDAYVVDSASDVVTESSGEGADTVQSSVTYTLSANVENLTLSGSSALNGTGNGDANVITGNSGNNTLAGLGGADTLDGGSGTDTVTYAASAAAVLVSLAAGTASGGDAEGDVLSNIENLTGSNFDDTLEGNAGNNVLTGGTGTDTISYANATSAVTVSLAIASSQNTGGAGSDTLSGFENLAGSAFNDTLTGTSSVNVLSGLAGNDTLSGGSGADTLIGGLGDDTYVVDNAGDVVTESASEGADTVQSSVTYTLSANVENLTLTGSSSISGTGNSDANVITGNSNNNTLTGLDGNDALNGGGGTDTFIGGLGDDTYVVDSSGDVVTESASEGADTVQSSITYTLGNNVEYLTLTGTSAINGTGNGDANIIVGNSGNNTLSGSGGDDRLEGGAGNDTLTGGSGSDTFAFKTGFGQDTITDFTVGAASDDVIEFQNGLFADVAAILAAASQSGSDTIITLDASNKITLTGVTVSNLHQDDFQII